MKRYFLSFFIIFILITAVPAVCAGAARDEIPAEIHEAVDLNGDGFCSIKDVNMILRHIVHLESLDQNTLVSADINDDGEINVRDATALRKIILYAYVPVKGITVDPASVSLHKGESQRISVSVTPKGADAEITFESSDPQIVSVDQSGKINALSIGTAIIKATDKSGASAVCTVNVTERPVETVTLDTDSVYLYAGKVKRLTASVSPDNADNKKLTYKSSDPSVASVDQYGAITALKEGVAQITVAAENGTSDTCIVYVYKNAVKYETVYTSAAVKRDCAVLEKLFPDLIKFSSIGKSAKGDNIALLTLGKGSRKVCVCAGIHSREIVTSSYVMRCVEEFAKAYGSQMPYGSYNVKNLLDKFTIYFVPACNPDGMDIYSANASTLYDYPDLDRYRLDFKANANGVNLNRNFPFLWDKITISDIDGRTSTDYSYKGDSAGSEPETQALMKLCEDNSFEWMFSMHLRGDCIYWKDTTNPSTSTDAALANALREKCGFYLMPTSTDVNGYGGGFENYFRCRYGKPGFCIELVPDDIQTPTYPGYYNSIFDSAVRWNQTKYIFLEAMSKS